MLLLYNSSHRRMIVKDWLNVFNSGRLNYISQNANKTDMFEHTEKVTVHHHAVTSVHLTFLKCMDYTITARLHILYIKATIWLYVHAEIIYEIRVEWL